MLNGISMAYQTLLVIYCESHPCGKIEMTLFNRYIYGGVKKFIPFRKVFYESGHNGAAVVQTRLLGGDSSVL